MEPIYREKITVSNDAVDCFGRLKPSFILYYAQEAAGRHCRDLSVDADTLSKKHLFWAIIRNRVQITRLPLSGETITIETWPMPTTKVAYPRSTVAYDAEGRELFRSIGLWVLMDLNTRNMILPGKSGISVIGTIRGTELAIPNSLIPRPLGNQHRRSVCFTDLDRNGHMNNARYMDWISDLLPSSFHLEHMPREFTVCYLSEAREGETLTVNWELKWEASKGSWLQVDACRKHSEDSTGHERVFSAKIVY